MAERNILKDKKLNKYMLNEEASNQSNIYHYWATKTAQAKAERDSLKEQVKKIEAEIMLSIAKGSYPIPLDQNKKPIKITNPIAAALVDNDESVNALRQDLILAEKHYNRVLAAENTIDQKRSMIKVLTELYIKDYYSTTYESTGVTRTKTDYSSDDQREKLNSRKNKSKEDN